MIKVFAFDLDGTLTQHRTPLGSKNRRILEKLAQNYTLLMVGAGTCTRIHDQLGGFPMDVIGNYGMQYAKYSNGILDPIRDDSVDFENKSLIEEKVTTFREKYGFTEFSGDSVEYHSSGCLTLPLLGTKAKIEDKLAFDPDRKKRRGFYAEISKAFPDFNVFIGGSSSFDMAPKPYNKYYALDLWCRENGYDHSEVIYVGDDYGTGGNDESLYRSDFRFICTDDHSRLDEVLAPWLDDLFTDIDGLLGSKTDCACGKTHTCEIDRVVIRHGALNELPAMTSDYRHILLVCDENTRRVCGNRVNELLEGQIDTVLTYTSDGFVIPNEEAVAKLGDGITRNTDLIIGVGSGVINDLCKYVSHSHGLPYYIVATAPSMDGYASKGAAMLFGGMKITTNAQVPKAIIADTAVLKDAPIEMLRAGYGDIIGKYSCLNDWRLSHIVNQEPLCDYIYSLTYNTLTGLAGIGKEIVSRDEKSIALLMHALVIVGIAMAYMGNSRPASGSEHHLSHYFEVIGLLRNEPYFCHGIDVAYSTYLTAKLRQELNAIEIPEGKVFNESQWESNIRRIYGTKASSTAADGIIALQKKLGRIHENKLPVYKEKWIEIRKILADSPSPEKILEMLESVGLPINEFEKLYSKEKLLDGIGYAKDLKDRYTVLWMYDQIK
ncbi:MAG: iron-containing alcohol dehydrogenase [Ruminococcaceae bacterium]|nr:iron-containing alcohol dehydrogenase [Oscillospiraceae bacterium]